MAKKINSNSFIDKKTQQVFDKLVQSMIKLNNEQKELINTITKSKATITSNNQAVKRANQVNELHQATLKETDALRKKQLKTEAKLVASKGKEAKQVARTNIQYQKSNKELKAIQAVRAAERGSINQLNAVNKVLRQRLNAVNMETAEGRQKAARLTRTIERNTAKVQANSDAMVKQKMNIGNYQSATKGLGKSMMNLKMKMMGVVMAGFAVVRGFSKLTGAFFTQEQSTKKLETSLKNAGDASKESLKDLQEFSDTLQQQTTVGDETTESLISLGLEMGVSTDKIKEATKGAVGLSKSLGVDTTAAMKMVARAMNDDYTMLERYNAELKSAETNAEKQAIVQKLMADGFNQATAEIETSSGAAQQLSNNFGDLKEKIGEAFVGEGTKASKAVKILNAVVTWLIENLKTVGTILKATIAFFVSYQVALTVATAKTKGLSKASGVLGRVFKWLKTLNPYALVAAGIAAATVAIITLTEKTNLFTTAKQRATKAAEDAMATYQTEKEQASKLFEELEALTEQQDLSNTERDRKKELINTLNKNYGDYLDNQISEKDNAEDIAGKQREVNQALREKIFLDIRNEKIAEIQKEQSKKQSEAYEDMAETLRTVGIDDPAERVRMLNFALKEGKDAFEKYNYGVEGMEKRMKKGQFESIIVDLRKWNDASKDAKEEIKALETQFNAMMGSAEEADGVFQGEFNVELPENLSRFTDNQIKKFKQLGTQYQKLINNAKTEGEFQKLINEYLSKRDKLVVGFTKETENNIEATKMWNKEIKEIEKGYKNTGDAIEEYIEKLKKLKKQSEDSEQSLKDFRDEMEKQSDEKAASATPDPESEKERIERLRNEYGNLGYETKKLQYSFKNMFNDPEAMETIQEYASVGVNAIGEISNAFGAFSDRRISEHEAEIHRLNKRYETDMEQAEGNEELQEKLTEKKERREEKLQQKILEEKQKQAKIDKATAIFEATVQGAVQVVKNLGNPILAGLIAASVAAQIATIAATPIPQFEKGTEDAPGGLAQINEAGQEAVIESDGSVKLYKGKDAIVDIPKHSQVITAKQTPELIKNIYTDKTDKIDSINIDNSRLLKDIRRNTRKQPIINNGLDLSRIDYIKKYIH